MTMSRRHYSTELLRKKIMEKYIRFGVLPCSDVNGSNHYSLGLIYASVTYVRQKEFG